MAATIAVTDPALSPGNMWEHFHDNQKNGIRSFGMSKESAFECAACALVGLVADIDTVLPRQEVELICEGLNSDEELLEAWLDTVRHEMVERNMLFCCFAVHIGPRYLSARAWGEKFDALHHTQYIDATCAMLGEAKVERLSGRQWLAQCLVDVRR